MRIRTPQSRQHSKAAGQSQPGSGQFHPPHPIRPPHGQVEAMESLAAFLGRHGTLSAELTDQLVAEFERACRHQMVHGMPDQRIVLEDWCVDYRGGLHYCGPQHAPGDVVPVVETLSMQFREQISESADDTSGQQPQAAGSENPTARWVNPGANTQATPAPVETVHRIEETDPALLTGAERDRRRALTELFGESLARRFGEKVLQEESHPTPPVPVEMVTVDRDWRLDPNWIFGAVVVAFVAVVVTAGMMVKRSRLVRLKSPAFVAGGENGLVQRPSPIRIGDETESVLRTGNQRGADSSDSPGRTENGIPANSAGASVSRPQVNLGSAVTPSDGSIGLAGNPLAAPGSPNRSENGHEIYGESPDESPGESLGTAGPSSPASDSNSSEIRGPDHSAESASEDELPDRLVDARESWQADEARGDLLDELIEGILEAPSEQLPSRAELELESGPTEIGKAGLLTRDVSELAQIPIDLMYSKGAGSQESEDSDRAEPIMTLRPLTKRMSKTTLDEFFRVDLEVEDLPLRSMAVELRKDSFPGMPKIGSRENSEIGDANRRFSKLEFPVSVPLALEPLAANGVQWITSKETGLQIAGLFRQNGAWKIRWTNAAEVDSWAARLVHGRLVDGQGERVYLRPSLHASACPVRIEASPERLSWDLGAGVLEHSSRLEFNLDVPDSLETRWVIPFNPARPRVSKALAAVSFANSGKDGAAIAIKASVDTTTHQLICDFQFAARLSSEAGWLSLNQGALAVESESVEVQLEQLSRRIAILNYQIARADLTLEKELKRRRENTEELLDELQDTQKRLKELGELVDEIDSAVALNFQLSVQWPDRDQQIIRTSGQQVETKVVDPEANAGK